MFRFIAIRNQVHTSSEATSYLPL
nr:unnamed protein product [Callosobruchus analis]